MYLWHMMYLKVQYIAATSIDWLHTYSITHDTLHEIETRRSLIFHTICHTAQVLSMIPSARLGSPNIIDKRFSTTSCPKQLH